MADASEDEEKEGRKRKVREWAAHLHLLDDLRGGAEAGLDAAHRRPAQEAVVLGLGLVARGAAAGAAAGAAGGRLVAFLQPLQTAAILQRRRPRNLIEEALSLSLAFFLPSLLSSSLPFTFLSFILPLCLPFLFSLKPPFLPPCFLFLSFFPSSLPSPFLSFLTF